MTAIVLTMGLAASTSLAEVAAEAEIPSRKPTRPAEPGPAVAETVGSPESPSIPAPVRTPAKPAAESEISGLIASLNSRDATARQEASNRLRATGKPAVAALANATRAGSLEVRVRAVSILREIYLSENQAAGDAAEAALTELATEKSPSVARRADQILEENFDVSEKRALREISRLGGIVNYTEEGAFVDANGQIREGRQLSHIILGANWKGGTDGLKHIKRLSKIQTRCALYYIPESGLTEEQLKDVQLSVPNMQVQRRGRACLGVSCVNDGAGGGCQVYRVVEGSAADKARFRIGDNIVAFSGQKVADFDGLIALIGTTKPGDKVKIEVQRDFQRLTLETVMDEWK